MLMLAETSKGIYKQILQTGETQTQPEWKRVLCGGSDQYQKWHQIIFRSSPMSHVFNEHKMIGVEMKGSGILFEC